MNVKGYAVQQNCLRSFIYRMMPEKYPRVQQVQSARCGRLETKCNVETSRAISIKCAKYLQ